MRAVVTDGRVRTRASTKALWLQAVQDQLPYVIGALRGTGVSADLSTVDIALRGEPTRESSGEYVVSYAAAFALGWPGQKPLPDQTQALPVLVPRNADADERQAFFQHFGAACGGAQADGTLANNFWSAYRPGLVGCPLQDADPAPEVTASTTRLDLWLELDDKTGSATKPDYAGLWRDRRVGAILVMPSAMAASRLAAWLRQTFGAPTTDGERVVFTIPERGELVVALSDAAAARRWSPQVWTSTEIVAIGSGADLRSAQRDVAALAHASGDAEGAPFGAATRLVLVSAQDRLAYADPSVRRAGLVVAVTPDDADEAAWRSAAVLITTVLEAHASYEELIASLREASGRSLRVRVYPEVLATAADLAGDL